MAIRSQIVEAKIIEDNRPSDGDLLLQLTPEIKLSVSSGHNIEERIYYTAILQPREGEKVIYFPLTIDMSIVLGSLVP